MFHATIFGYGLSDALLCYVVLFYVIILHYIMIDSNLFYYILL